MKAIEAKATCAESQPCAYTLRVDSVIDPSSLATQGRLTKLLALDTKTIDHFVLGHALRISFRKMEIIKHG